MKDKATSRRQTAFALTVFAIVMKMALSSLASFLSELVAILYPSSFFLAERVGFEPTEPF